MKVAVINVPAVGTFLVAASGEGGPGAFKRGSAGFAIAQDIGHQNNATPLPLAARREFGVSASI